MEVTLSDDSRAVPLPPKPAPGVEYVVDAPGTMSVDEIRSLVRKQLGFTCHIKAKIGPFTVTETGFGAPVEPIDDPFLNGNFKFELTNIRLGSCKYFIVLKQAVQEV